LFLERADAVQSAIVMGRVGPGRLEPGHEAREVVDGAFGGLFTSRLNSNLRERHGYTYGAFSTLVAHRDQGAWFSSSSVRADSTAPAVVQMVLEIERLLTEPLGPEEVARASADLVQRRWSRLEHDALLLAGVREPFVFDLPLTHEAGYAARLSSLTPDALADAARSLAGGPFVTAVVAAPEQAGELREQGFEVVAADPIWLE
jgi:zinc protease